MKSFNLKSSLFLFLFISLLSFGLQSCKNNASADAAAENTETAATDDANQNTSETTETSTEATSETDTGGETDGTEEANNQVEVDVTEELTKLEAEYAEMLAPIASLKDSKPKTYWFIVSWLKTAYKTPDWTGYYSEEWKKQAKTNGIDCSGFARVMLDQIFDKQVAGGSQRLLDVYSNRVAKADLQMGDLVFFRAPYSETDKIVHVGVYLQDNYFAHATSTRSAAKGLGLKVDSLEDERWSKELVTGGRIKEES